MIELLIRVVIDTSVWISAFINPTGPPAQLLELVLRGDVALVLSDNLINAIREVSRRAGVRRRLRVDPDAIDRLLERIRPDAVEIVTNGELQLWRDPNDDAILETAVRGRAQYLISRDDDLKRDPGLIDQLASFGVSVISMARFLELLDAGFA
jgi:putative PIN family toxin of toxin-antitoxin system